MYEFMSIKKRMINNKILTLATSEEGIKDYRDGVSNY